MKLLNCYMVKLLDCFKYYGEKTTSQKPKEIHSTGEGEDSPGGFGFRKTKTTN